MAAHRYIVNTDVVAAKVYDDEAVIINTATGRYHDLEGSGLAAWYALEHGTTAAELARSLHLEMDVTEAAAHADVEALFDRMLAEGLIVTDTGESAPQAVPPAAAERSPYMPPVLTTFSDMQELLAVDPPLPASYTTVVPPLPGAEP